MEFGSGHCVTVWLDKGISLMMTYRRLDGIDLGGQAPRGRPVALGNAGPGSTRRQALKISVQYHRSSTRDKTFTIKALAAR